MSETPQIVMAIDPITPLEQISDIDERIEAALKALAVQVEAAGLTGQVTLSYDFEDVPDGVHLIFTATPIPPPTFDELIGADAKGRA